MAREPMQDTYQRLHWKLFRRPGEFFYDYAVLYEQRNYLRCGTVETVIVCPWLAKTYHAWLGSMAAHEDFNRELHAAITALSGRVYHDGDGAMTQAFCREQAIFLDGAAWARTRPLIMGPRAEPAVPNPTTRGLALVWEPFRLLRHP